jgi:hypothetical protein
VTPQQKLALVETLDRVIRENNVWTNLRAFGAYEDLWEIVYGDACLAVEVSEAARMAVTEDKT